MLLALTVGLLGLSWRSTAASRRSSWAGAPAVLTAGLPLVVARRRAGVPGPHLHRPRAAKPPSPARQASGSSGLRLAVMIAVGIGLHNLGEGLAIGSAYAVGELALGAFLVIGFALHNTTEGIAIVAPLATERRP
ncbi:MAG: hypothetical protein WKF47_10420 [Geodermatophilaceae bacterium]